VECGRCPHCIPYSHLKGVGVCGLEEPPVPISLDKYWKKSRNGSAPSDLSSGDILISLEKARRIRISEVAARNQWESIFTLQHLSDDKPMVALDEELPSWCQASYVTVGNSSTIAEDDIED